MDVLLDEGLVYDASLFPVPRENGGYPCPVEPHLFGQKLLWQLQWSVGECRQQLRCLPRARVSTNHTSCLPNMVVDRNSSNA